MFEFKYPFTPPAEDLAMEGVTANGIRFAIYDTFCKEPMTPEQKAEKDRRILEIYRRSAERKYLERLRRTYDKG